jgi:hypothetical protein
MLWRTELAQRPKVFLPVPKSLLHALENLSHKKPRGTVNEKRIWQ